jgi:predicted 2-oxoglutarate/Fe(II)-dependent dioxygenase YbiX
MKTFSTEQLWDSDRCEKIVEAAQRNNPHTAAVEHGGVTGEQPEIRSASRYHVDSVDVIHPLWQLVQRHNEEWGFDIEILPHAEVIRYQPGDFYKPHTDWGGSYVNRKLTATIQLSDPGKYTGGGVLLYDGPERWEVEQNQGLATLFPSWTLHSVDPLLTGERWALVAWALGPKFR